MDDDRSDALNGAALEREIETALAVDPSPEFLAGVRLRIASEPVSSAWRIPWVFAAGAMALVIVMAVVAFRPDRKPNQASTGRVAVATTVVTKTALPPVPPTVPPSVAAAVVEGWTASGQSAARVAPTRSGGARFVRGPSTRRSMDPEVLVSPDEAAGLRRLIAAVRDGRIDFTSLLIESPQATAALQPPSEISVSPITIEPLEPLTTGEGVLQ